MVIDSYRYMSSFHLSFCFDWIFDKPRFSFTDDICTVFFFKIVNRVPPSASACVFAYVAFGPTSGEIFNYRSLTRIQFLNKLKNLFVTPHLHIYNLFIHRRVIQVRKKKNLNYQTLYWYVSADTISKTVQKQKSGINLKSRFALV